jgi:hypothetical protein
MMFVGLPMLIATSTAVASATWLSLRLWQRLLSPRSPADHSADAREGRGGHGAAPALVRCDVCGVYVVAQSARRCGTNGCPHPG